MQPASTIYIRLDLKEKLEGLKRNPKESYNIVLERLLTDDATYRNDEAIRILEEALSGIRSLHPAAEEPFIGGFDPE